MTFWKSIFFILVLFLAARSIQATTPTPSPALDLTSNAPDTPAPIELLTPVVISIRPHDTGSYTQGLLLYDGYFYESAGLYGESDLRKVDPETGAVFQQIDLPVEFFAEGLALVDERLIQLTWKEGQAFVYDRDSFEQLEPFAYTGEGWGLCYDGEQLWMSDGTETLVSRDPETFEITGEVAVTFLGYPLGQIPLALGVSLGALNELECVGEAIYANVYLTDFILRIDKASGRVTGLIVAFGLLTADERAALSLDEVLNGIAYDPENEVFFLTGKHWPKLFKVRFNRWGEISD
jgi:Glutamine cyclotransferase